ncbi:MAG: lanthionine synthetase LanC family protein [Geminicoccaceae bacterium]
MNEHSKNGFLSVAASIGARLCRDALWDGERCTWQGASMELVQHQWRVVQRVFGPDLYAGASGVGLFLARLSEATGEAIFRETALGAARAAARSSAHGADAGAFSVYSGLAGTAWALIEIGERCEAETLAETGWQHLAKLKERPLDDAMVDIVSGSAGLIPLLLDLHERRLELGLLELAISHGEHLLGSARRQGEGCSWDAMPGITSQDPTGFAHGASGIAWALLELGVATDDHRFKEAAERGFLYERGCYSAEHRNWPDFRMDDGQSGQAVAGPGYGIAWCHGAAGIGLARLRAYELTGDPVHKEEANIAIRTTGDALQAHYSGAYVNYSLCHGQFGNAELLLDAASRLDEDQWLALPTAIASEAASRIEGGRQPWPCGVLGAGETPGLMLGLAGIGHFYLRLHDADKAPSLLTIGA